MIPKFGYIGTSMVINLKIKLKGAFLIYYTKDGLQKAVIFYKHIATKSTKGNLTNKCVYFIV